ncbi:RraA family protein [Bacteroides uniformis]|jgi:4-hydroxy-4-methyl-2-oxoglutarate aldolase|uniref:RraA family protein n=1 Tax=Bacteroides uniformis TaxID=820 RepID=UPI00189912D0|nr:RraA family protein [Bacteroides uniformis]
MADKNLMKLDKLREKLDKIEMAEFPISEAELCDRYERLYTGAVNDVLREATFMDQALPINILPLKFEMVSCGIAFTVRSNPDPTVGGEMEIRAKMLDDMPCNCCVVWDAGEETEAAHWGEVMTASAIARGARCAVVNGGLRDTRKVLAQNFPVFYRYRSSNGSLGRTKITGYNIPVRIGKVYIKPGDVIFGDIDGVVVIPRAIAYDVLVRAEEINTNEREMRGWVHPGFSAVEMVNNGGYF